MKFKSGQQAGQHHGNMRRYGEIHYEREMKTWRPFRYCGVLASLCALLLGSAAAWSHQWLTGRGKVPPILLESPVAHQKRKESTYPPPTNYMPAVSYLFDSLCCTLVTFSMHPVA